MKVNGTRIFLFLFLAVLIAAPIVAYALPRPGFVSSEDNGDGFDIGKLFEEGAEIVFAHIDEEGVPAVIFGQLGVPATGLDLDDPMYDNCLVMALVAARGELLQYALDLFMGEQENGGNGFLPKQFGDTMPFDITSLLGQDLSLLATAYLNLDQATSTQRMTSILNHFQTNYQFVFAEIFTFRLDESSFPPEMEIELPFDSLDIYIYQVTNEFTAAVSAVASAMNPNGFLSAIDTSIFTTEEMSAAGLLAVPRMQDLMDLFGGFGGEGQFFLADEFFPSQFPDIEGPLAVAAAGYIGEQILSTNDDQLDIFADLLGSTSTVSPLDDGLSIVVASMPSSVNITSYAPEQQANNLTFHDPDTNIVFWNATGLGDQNDYTLYFTGGEFPPLVKISRSFSPDKAAVGGTVEVTVTVTNEGTEPIENVNIADTGFEALYDTVAVSGTRTKSVANLSAGASESISYTATFQNEGGYTFPKAVANYTYDGVTYVKDTSIDGYVVEADPVSVLTEAFWDGWPYTGAVVGLIGVGFVWNVVALVRGRGGGGYEV